MLAIVLALAASPGAASARQTKELQYPFEQVWGTAVRLLRVDYGFPIRDRDEDIGFVLFDYVDAGRTYQGSVEIVRVEPRENTSVRRRPGTTLELPGVRVAMHIPSMPSYVERMLLDRLERKLREDYGLPVQPPRRPAEPPAEEPPEGEGGAPDGESERRDVGAPDGAGRAERE